jgi:hypothetical protein
MPESFVYTDPGITTNPRFPVIKSIKAPIAIRVYFSPNFIPLK